jgi:hypothetical protein
MHFDTKNYLKSNHYHTTKRSLNIKGAFKKGKIKVENIAITRITKLHF